MLTPGGRFRLVAALDVPSAAMAIVPPPYRAAIIGTGRIASLLERDPLRAKPHTHAGWYASDPRTTIVAGCDVDAERLASFGEDWGVDAAHLYDDYRLLLERERPDIVSVCAYAADRVAMSRAALAAGARGLWIEKAVACTVDEAEGLGAGGRAAACRRRGPPASAGRPVSRRRALGARRDVRPSREHPRAVQWPRRPHRDARVGPAARLVRAMGAGGRVAGHARTRGGGQRRRRRSETSRRRHDTLTHCTSGVPDRGGRARIVFENGVEAFVTGGAKRYFVFQCDLVCAGGRIRVGNDVRELLVPADSPRYTGYRELAPIDPASSMMPGDRRTSSVRGVAERDGVRESPPLSIDAATRALALGVAVMQAGLTRRTVTPETLDRSLRIASI